MQPPVHHTDLERHAASRIGTALSAYRAVAEADGRAPLAGLRAALGTAHAPHLEIAAPEDGGYRVLAAGPAAAAAAGADLSGRRLDEAPAALAALLASVLAQALAERRPLLTVQRSLDPADARLWDRLVLPCRDEDGADRLLTVVRPRQRRVELLDAVLEASRDGIMSLRALRDEAGRIADAVVLTANGRAAEYTGHPVERLVAGTLRDLLPGLFQAGLWARCLKVMEERATERFELNIAHARLDTWLRFTLAPLEDGFVMSFSDVTDLKYALFEAEVTRQDLAAEIEQRQALEAELRRLSVTDDLTGVLNRRGFADAVRGQAALATRHGHELSLLALDIDHFKAVNDRFGHAGGDTVLQGVAALFCGSARIDVDIVGRVGGEEFMILLPHTGLSGALAFAERLRARLAETPIPVAGDRVHVTTSIGVHAFRPGSSPERMLLDADKALYRAKSLGRNRTVALEPADA